MFGGGGGGLHRCFNRLKKRHSRSTPRLTISDSQNAPSTTTASSSSSATTSTSVLFKNFNSLYDPAASDTETLTLTLTRSSSSSSPSPSPTPSDRDLSSAIASRRFFPASPGRSKSILDSAAVAVVGIGAGVAVPTFSPDPYGDFRRSMEEMVAALGLEKGAHWAHLQELLLCYLALNRKQDHKYIIVAFADLLLSLAEGDA